jgi:hypothetical protein
MTKDFAYHPAPRTYLTHPHGVRIVGLIEQMFGGIANAASSRGIRFHITPCGPEVLSLGRHRNSAVIFRQHFDNDQFVQVPLLHLIVDLVHRNPERRVVRNRGCLAATHRLAGQLDQYSYAHRGGMYDGCGLLFNDLDQLIRQILRTASHYCVGQIELWPMAVAGTDQDRDMAVMNFVLRDELETDGDYDYQITLVWNGPMRFNKIYAAMLNGQA